MLPLFNRRKTRGSVLILALIMATLLAGLTLSFASRIVSNEHRMEVDNAAIYAAEVADSAVSWNMRRIFDGFDLQNDAYKYGSSTTSPTAWMPTIMRTTDTAAAGSYDFIGGTGPTFAQRWVDPDAWVRWGPGEVKLSAKILQTNSSLRYNIVELKAWARYTDAISNRPIEREVRRTVKYTVLGNNKIYDFAYFANNYGWMYGSTIYIHGNMGSNGDLGFQSGPTVNGALYAATNPDIGAAGVIKSGAPYTNPVFQTLPAYRSAPAGMVTGDRMVLPPNPAYTEDVNNNKALDAGEDKNANALLDQIDYSLGYKGTQDKLTGQKPLDIPYLGDLSYFKNEANSFQRPANPAIGDGGGQGGQIKQLKAPGLDPTNPANYNVIVGATPGDAVYGDDGGEDGRHATWQTSGGTLTVDTKPIPQKLDPARQERNGNLALIGTAAQPLVITGPVVVTNDLVIRGVVKGQGTVFVGRNTHLVGDLTYSNPPDWRNPSDAVNTTNMNNPNFNTTKTSNQGKDLVAFATKGSMLLGQYNRTDDSWNTCKSNYFKTGFQNNTLQSYQVDPSDAAIGYVSGYVSGKPYFAGDYTVAETDTLGGLPVAAKRYNDVANWTTTGPTQNRTYMESSFPNDFIQKLSTAGTNSTTNTTTFLGPGDPANSATNASISRPAQLWGVFYTNHLFGGRVGAATTGVKFYGTMVARDEGVIFTSKCQFVYDPRVSDRENSSHVEIFVPIGSLFQQLAWEELTPGM